MAAKSWLNWERILLFVQVSQINSSNNESHHHWEDKGTELYYYTLIYDVISGWFQKWSCNDVLRSAV